MEIERIIPDGKRMPKGIVTSGIAVFNDGKEWRFSAEPGKKIFFTIDSGIPSQWSVTNFGRDIAPLRRVDALKFFLETHCRACLNETPPNEAACIHCGKMKLES
ncbi:hypothetical protein [Roseibium album]|uniref:hypothetical protein n=1 Tax=Roseibium album TaxID=311410 RepID=UPI002492E75F|nr:hypothetical protein [Roseibium album]